LRALVLSSSLVIGLIAVATAPQPALAQSTGLEDLVGARAGQAEGELERRGYRNVGGAKGDDRSYTNWWNADRRQCVTIATMDGRYASITQTTAPDCRQPAVRPRPQYDYQNQTATPPRSGQVPDSGFPQPSAPPPEYDRRGYPNGGPVISGRPVDLALVCFGDGARNGIASGTTWTWNPDRDRYEYDRYNQSTTEVFDASLMIQTWPGGGRIRLPRSLIPPINSRGNRGWWDLYDVSAGPDVIRASYRLNGLNKPRLTIDRRSGRIKVQGTASYAFRGTCDLVGNNPRRI
jgi:hypothetical protein